jgi:hypothetical protein
MILFHLLLGHLVGDYLLQSRLMATDKGQHRSWRGLLYCVAHCLLYTLTVVLFLFPWLDWLTYPALVIGVFLSHFIVDRYSLANWWARVIRGRSFEAARQEPDSDKRPFTIAFTCVVYAVSDNTMHLLLMYGLLQLLHMV